MHRSRRGLVVLLLALLLATMSGSAGAFADLGTPPRPDDTVPDLTRAEARELLSEVKGQVREDTRRIDEQEPVGQGTQTDLTLALRDLALARPLLSDAERRQAEYLLSRPSDPGGDQDWGIDYEDRTPQEHCPAGGVACIHYVTGGPERVDPTDRDGDSVPDFVETVHTVVEQVWAAEVGRMGYRAPLPDGGAGGRAGNPDARLDVFLAELGDRGLYGYCAPEGPAKARKVPGYCVLDNDYAVEQYAMNPTLALKATAAHEFFHAVQFGYDLAEDPWFMEGSATWVEDEVYDSINDNRQFLSHSKIRYPRSPADYSTGLHRYGAWLFFRFASERLGSDVVRRMWDIASAGNGTPYSMQAFRSAVAARTPWQPFVSLFHSWNTLPTGSYSERRGYPTPVYTRDQRLTPTRRGTGPVRVNLPHLSGSSVRVKPGFRLSTARRLAVTINAPATRRGSRALIQTRFRTGRTTHSVVRLDAAGNAQRRMGFNRRKVAAVVVVVSNTSTAMRDCGKVTNEDGAIYSCAGRGIYDRNQPYVVRARLL